MEKGQRMGEKCDKSFPVFNSFGDFACFLFRKADLRNGISTENVFPRFPFVYNL